MATKPIKRAGFRQSLYAQSATMLESLGTIRKTMDGRIYRYAYLANYAADLAVGKMTRAFDINATFTNEELFNIALDTTNITFTLNSAGAGNSMPLNALTGGQLQINDATGEGYGYGIEWSSAITTASTTVNIKLDQGIKLATSTDGEASIVPSPWGGSGVLLNAADASPVPTGVAMIPVTAAYYCWLQTGGMGACLCAGAPGAGLDLRCDGQTAGAVYGSVGTGTTAIVGRMLDTGVTTEYKPVFFTIDM